MKNQEQTLSSKELIANAIAKLNRDSFFMP